MRAEDQDLLERVEQLIDALRSHSDPGVVAMVTEMLQGIDRVHRDALTQLMEKIRQMAGEPFVNRLCEDANIRLLLMAYDLVPLDRRLVAEEALDVVREQLQPRGIEIRLQDVVGGVVTVNLHGARNDIDGNHEVVGMIEATLGEHLPGFQQVEIERPPASGTASDPVHLGGTRNLP